MGIKNTLIIYTDGGSRGNPGIAGYGVYIENDKGEEIATLSNKIGITTNNVAEYNGVLNALKWVLKQKRLPFREITIFMDSLLLYSQLVGLYKVKNPTLANLLFEIRLLEAQIKIPIRYFHVRREKNKKADFLVNLALDNRL